MISATVQAELPTVNDARLIEEAVRRLQASSQNGAFDTTSLVHALSHEVHRGRRDMFSLVRAGQRIIDER